jgi:polyhydroxyalkanoate synthesis regulator phasin
MRSRILKAVYTGLGLADTGKKSLESLARQLAEKAALSEEDGEEIALRLRARSDKAFKSLQKTINTKVEQVIESLHAATRADLRKLAGKKRKAHAAGRPKRRRHPHAAKSHASHAA